MGNHQWQLLVAGHALEIPLLESEVLEVAVLAYIATVVRNLKTTFGIENFPMTARYVGQAIYIHNPCTRCGSRVGFWCCGDGQTIVLKCERCDKSWDKPQSVPTSSVKPILAEEESTLTVSLVQRGISRWATIEEIQSLGWMVWIAPLRFETSELSSKVLKVRINVTE